jgi:hypothetical protein
MEHLLQTLWPARLTFQIVATENTIVWQVLDIGNLHTPNQITQAIRARNSKAVVTAAPYQPPDVTAPFERHTLFYRQIGDIIAPIKITDDDDVKKVDPLVTLVNHMSDIPAGTQVTYTMHVVGHLSEKEHKNARERVKTLNFHWIEAIDNPINVLIKVGMRAATDQMKTDKYGDAQTMVTERLRDALLNTYLAVQVDSVITPNNVDRGGLYGLYSSLNEFASRTGTNGIFPYPEDNFDKTRIYIDTELVEQRTNTVHLVHMFTQNLEHLEQASTLPVNPNQHITCGSCGSQNTLGKQNCTNKGCKYHLPSPWQVISGAMVLTPKELAVLWHLPHDEFTASEIQWVTGGKAPDMLTQRTSGVVIGDNEYIERKTPVYFTDDDRRTGMYILGKPGMGKSMYMHNLIHQDIANGYGVAVIDPHGELVNNILGTSIPPNRENDLIIIDLDDDTYAVPLNPLIIPSEPGQIAVGRLLAAMNTVYDFSIAPRAADALRAALVTLAVEPNPTIRDIIRLYYDSQFRDEIKRRAQGTIKDRLTVEFWQSYEGKSDYAKDELVYPVVHRLRGLYGNDFLYPMLCHPHSVDIAQAIAQRKIVLVSLHTDKDKVPEDQRRLIGALLISTFEAAARKSAKDGDPNYYLFIDEVQNFVTTSISIALTEARKFNLSVHI